jgi:hypothetical protein
LDVPVDVDDPDTKELASDCVSTFILYNPSELPRDELSGDVRILSSPKPVMSWIDEDNRMDVDLKMGDFKEDIPVVSKLLEVGSGRH